MHLGSQKQVSLSRLIRQQMIEHALRELPNECCGVLLGREAAIERLVPMRSTPPAPDTYFMDPEQQIDVFSDMERRGEQLLGIYHSHPCGPAHPSGMDLQLAFHRDAVYIIVSLHNRDAPEVRAFARGEYEFINIELNLV